MRNAVFFALLIISVLATTAYVIDGEKRALVVTGVSALTLLAMMLSGG